MTSYDWYNLSDAATFLTVGLAGGVVGYALRGLIGRWNSDSIEKQAQLRLEEAEMEVKSKLKEADILARAEVVKVREEFEKQTKTRRNELEEIDRRLSLREENLDKKNEVLDKKEAAFAQKSEVFEQQREELKGKQQDCDKKYQEAVTRLQRMAGFTVDEARKEVYHRAESELRTEAGSLARKIQEEAKETADREARRLVALATQRYAMSHGGDGMTAIVTLGNDEVKGRIIGREGRNIRALEAATGASMLVDDTPGAVVISCFDPLRREIAKRALEQLVADGRIHPARIEEVITHVKENLEDVIREVGETACYEAKVAAVDPSIIKVLGRLRFRTSYTQNVLQHSIEVAHLMGLMAGELDLDPAIARRMGLFHDIGKAIDQEVQGGHAVIGAELLRQAGESPLVVNGVAAHHGDVEAQSLYAILCSTADAISSSRPGARVEAAGLYVQRLEQLEKIVSSFPGVLKNYAVQAGRELRVIVKPEEIDDNDAQLLARDIARKIEADMQYPGQIRVVVTRETRCIEFAK